MKITIFYRYFYKKKIKFVHPIFLHNRYIYIKRISMKIIKGLYGKYIYIFLVDVGLLNTGIIYAQKNYTYISDNKTTTT